MKDIPLSVIQSQRHRIFSDDDINELAKSLERHGQFFPIKLREHPKKAGRFEVIYGSRRLAAANKLGWNTISADIVRASDEDALTMSISENIDRKDFTDYEKALLLERLRAITGKTYADLASLINRSESYVAQHIAMLHLFPEGTTSEESTQLLQLLTEKHARALSKIEDPIERLHTAKLAIKANLSVRELEKICNTHGKGRVSGVTKKEKDAISRIICEVISALCAKDLVKFFDPIAESYFSMFSRFPPFEKMNTKDSMNYFSNLLKGIDEYKAHAEDMDIQVFGNFAYATFYEFHEITVGRRITKTRTRATIIFVKQESTWKIVHEHWSSANPSEFLNLLNYLTPRIVKNHAVVRLQ